MKRKFALYLISTLLAVVGVFSVVNLSIAEKKLTDTKKENREGVRVYLSSGFLSLQTRNDGVFFVEADSTLTYDQARKFLEVYYQNTSRSPAIVLQQIEKAIVPGESEFLEFVGDLARKQAFDFVLYPPGTGHNGGAHELQASLTQFLKTGTIQENAKSDSRKLV